MVRRWRGGDGARVDRRDGALTVKTLKKKLVWHVGDLSRRRVSDRSFEGNALSVSMHPVAWSRIARLDSSLYRMRRRDGHPGLFVDLTSPPDDLLKRAVRAGFAERGTAWQHSYWDDELDSEVSVLFASEEDAARESDEGDGTVEQVEVLLPTSRLRRLHRDLSLALVSDFAVMALLEEGEPRVDGVWWREALDPAIYSAPRGAIFQSRLPRWAAETVPWEDAPDA